MTDYIKYWKEKQVELHNSLEPTLVHGGSGHYNHVNIGDTVWIITLRKGKLSLLGRIVVGEVIEYKEAVKRYGKNVYKAKYHVVAEPETVEENREVNIMDIAGDLRFPTSSERDRLIIINNRVDGKQLQSLRKITQNSVNLLKSKWYNDDLQDLALVEHQISVGAGFGNPEKNKKVEKAAIDFVTKLYQDDGWSVKSVEVQKCGYDLLCSKGNLEEHIEVKGISGKSISFIITANEVNQAKIDSKLVICAVTSALSASPQNNRYSGSEFLKQFSLDEIAYRALLNSK